MISCKVADFVGCSFKREIGMIGKIWSIAHESGNDWNNEKLQKYLSGNNLELPNLPFLHPKGCCDNGNACEKQNDRPYDGR